MRFIDTAGMRRGTKVRGVEYYSVLRAHDAIEAAHVAVLVLEAPEGLTAEDKKIANLVMDAGRGLMLAANKWDLVEDKDRWFKRLQDEVELYARATVLRTSATRGQGVHRLGPLLLDLHARWSSRATTSTGERDRPGRAARAADADAHGDLALRDAGLDRTTVVRDLRRRTAAEPDLPAVPREPTAPGAAARRGPDPPAVPSSLARASLTAPRGRSGWLSCAGRPSFLGRDGPWRSLVSASDWGSEGRRFESGRPDG